MSGDAALDSGMSDDDSPSPGLSQARTDLAEDRTVLANERTFASWFRTGFAAVGIGLGFQALFLRMEPAWVPGRSRLYSSASASSCSSLPSAAPATCSAASASIR